MEDPSDVLYELLDMISTAVQPAGLEAGPDPATNAIALPMQLHFACSACGTRSVPLEFVQLIHNVFACDLRESAAAAGGQQEGGLQLGCLLRSATQKHTKTCTAAGDPHDGASTAPFVE